MPILYILGHILCFTHFLQNVVLYVSRETEYAIFKKNVSCETTKYSNGENTDIILNID